MQKSNPVGGSGIWTPLILPDGTLQTYHGYRWAEVKSTFMNKKDMDEVVGTGEKFFPNNDDARAREVYEVFELSSRLTDEQKMLTELWAQEGSGTITPPAALLWTWGDYVVRFMPDGYQTSAGEMDVHMLSMLDLGVHLFEGSRVTWQLKTNHVQARPIQEIRYRFPEIALPSWRDGKPAPGKAWLPFQPRDFITPPFADFTSGHSHFTQVFARVMGKWFGCTFDPQSLPVKYRAQPELGIVSRVLSETAGTPQLFGSYLMRKGSSIVQPRIAPSKDVTLAYTSWLDMAQASGISRLVGGLHTIRAHLGSLSSADALHLKVEQSWSIKTRAQDAACSKLGYA